MSKLTEYLPCVVIVVVNPHAGVHTDAENCVSTMRNHAFAKIDLKRVKFIILSLEISMQGM